MKRDPSDEEGLRTPSTSDRESDSERPTIARASLGWSLVAIGILVGFAIGGRIGNADSSSASSSRVGDALPVISAIAYPVPSPIATASIEISRIETAEPAADGSYQLAANSTAAASALRTAAPSGVVFASQSVAVAEAIAAAESRNDVDANADYQLASRGRTVPIENLPIYREETIQPRTGDIDDPADSLTIVTRGKIGSGQSLGSSLRRQGISPGTVHLIAKEMRKIFDFRQSRPGDRYRLGQDSDGRVLDFRYSQGGEESFYLSWNGARYVVKKETAELRPQIAKIAGIVDSSFYGAVLALGEQSALAAEFTRILAWDIDFSRSVHPGDEFQILYERLYRVNDDGEDVYVRPGRILAGRYDGRSGEHTVVYFEEEDGHGSYFRPDGTSVERAFLAAPLEFSRISSRFTWARRHPILQVTRPHPGIDYAAPHGTPIWSVAAGVVEYKARAGASGNLIRIRHVGGLTSHYAHLASFANDLKVGDRVEQKQVIGYVGSTGLSTGPHVCFRVKRDGHYVDPMKISGPAGEPVEKERFASFRSVRDQLLADLGPGPLAMADEAL